MSAQEASLTPDSCGWTTRLRSTSGALVGMKLAAEVAIQASLADAERHQRLIRYLPASSTDKKATARRLLAEFPINEGLICVLRVIEPCMSFQYQRSAGLEPDVHEAEARMKVVVVEVEALAGL